MVLIFRSNLCFETEPLLEFGSWTELKSTQPKRQKPLKMKSMELQGDLLLKETTTETRSDANVRFYPSTRKKQDPRQSWGISSWLLHGMKDHCSTAAHDQSVHREDDGAVRFDDILKEFEKKKFNVALKWSFGNWIFILAKGGRPKKRFQFCLDPNSSKHFLYFRAIQGHELQDSVLLPEGFTECIYHVGNASEMLSIIRSGLIPGGRSLKRGRQSVLFTIVKITVWRTLHATWPIPGSLHTKILGNLFQNTVYWVNLKFAQERGLQFDQTRSNAIVLYNTLPAVCIEKAVCMKTKEELYLKVRLTPRLPRVVLKPNSRSTRSTST